MWGDVETEGGKRESDSRDTWGKERMGERACKGKMHRGIYGEIKGREVEVKLVKGRGGGAEWHEIRERNEGKRKSSFFVTDCVYTCMSFCWCVNTGMCCTHMKHMDVCLYSCVQVWCWQASPTLRPRRRSQRGCVCRSAKCLHLSANRMAVMLHSHTHPSECHLLLRYFE